MPTLTQSPTLGDLLKYELNGNYSRETVTLKAGANHPLGAVLGQVTATGKYILSPAAAVVGDEGAEVASAVLIEAVDATAGDKTTRIDLRVAEVANPGPGDRIEIDGEAFLIQGEPVRDRERLVWTVDLRPA